MIRVLVADHQPIVSYGIRMLFENSTDIKIVNTASSAKQLLDYLKKESLERYQALIKRLGLRK